MPEPLPFQADDESALAALPPELASVEARLLRRLDALPSGPSPEVERRLLLVAREQGERLRRAARARELARRTRRLSTFLVRPAAAAAVLLAAALVAGRNAPDPRALASAVPVRQAPFPAAARVLSAAGALGQGALPKLAGMSVAPDEPLTVRPGGHLLLQLPCGTKLGLDGGSSGRLCFDPRARRLTLDRGRLWADVVPIDRGPDPRPILVDTPAGRARVIGTELTLRATAARTLVGVRHGQVRLEGARGVTLVNAEETGLLAEGFPPEARKTGAIERQFRWIGKLQPRAAHPCERPTGGGPISEDEAALGRLVARLQDGRELPLQLRAQAFEAEVSEGLVRVTATCSFVNHTPDTLEGTFSLQLPQQASIARYAVSIDGQLVEGDVVERERARQIYEEAKRRLDQPGLLEWSQGNLFTAKVHPIEPGVEKTIVVGWVEELPERDGVSRLLLPLVSGATQTTPPGLLSIEVRLRGELLRAPFRCPSHFVRAVQTPAARVLRLDARDLRPRNDFVLELLRRDAPAVEATLAPGEALAPATALIQLRPQLGRLLEEELPERVAVVLDASRSQAGTLKEVQLELLEALLQALPARARPRVFLLHVDLQELEAEGRAPVESLLAQAWSTEPAGGADYGRGFARLSRALPPDWGGVLVLVGDGLPSCGEREPAALAASFARALPPAQVRRVVTVGLGSAVDEALLGRIARERAGVHVGLRPGDDLARKLDEVLGALTRPVLGQVQVQLELAGSRELTPRRPRSVRAGEALAVLARVPAASRGGVVHLSGVVNGRSFRLRAPFAFRRAPEQSGLDGLWARKRVQDLLEEGPASKPAVLELALDHGIVTPYTSLLVLPEDKRAAYAVEARERRVARRVELLRAETERLLAAGEDQAAERLLAELVPLAGEDPRVRALSRELEVRLGPPEPEPGQASSGASEAITLLPQAGSSELALATKVELGRVRFAAGREESEVLLGTTLALENGAKDDAVPKTVRKAERDVERDREDPASQRDRTEERREADRTAEELLQKGDLAAARESFDKALEAAPDDARVLLQRAKLRRAQGDLSGAAAEAERALTLAPEESDAHRERAEALRGLGDSEGARMAEGKAQALDQLGREAQNRLPARAGHGPAGGAKAPEKPIVILAEEDEATRDLGKGADLSKPADDSGVDLAPPVDNYGLGGGGGAGGSGERAALAEPAPPVNAPAKAPATPPPPAPKPEPRKRPAPVVAPPPERKARETDGKHRPGAAPPEPPASEAPVAGKKVATFSIDTTPATPPATTPPAGSPAWKESERYPVDGFFGGADTIAPVDKAIPVPDARSITPGAGDVMQPGGSRDFVPWTTSESGMTQIDPPTLQLNSGPAPAAGTALGFADEKPVVAGGAWDQARQVEEEKKKEKADEDSDGDRARELARTGLERATTELREEVRAREPGPAQMKVPPLPRLNAKSAVDKEFFSAEAASPQAPTTGDRFFATNQAGVVFYEDANAPALHGGDPRELATAKSLFREGDQARDSSFDSGTLAELSKTELLDGVLGAGQAQGYRFSGGRSKAHDPAAGLRLELQRLQASDPETRPALFDALRGRCLQDLRATPALQAWFATELLRWAPEDLDLHQARGDAWRAQGQVGRAWRAYSGIVEARPDDATAQVRYARALWQLGLRDQALAALSEAVRLEPGEPRHRFLLARLAARAGKLRLAERAYRELLAIPAAAEAARAELQALLGRR